MVITAICRMMVTVRPVGSMMTIYKLMTKDDSIGKKQKTQYEGPGCHLAKV